MSRGNSRGARSRRAASAIEPAVFVLLVLLYIWIIQPTHDDRLRIPVMVAIVLLPFVSAYLHGDGLRDLGLRIDNIGASAREVGLATLAGAVAIVAIGLLAGHAPESRSGIVGAVFLYPFWGLAQQYAMQSFTYRRFHEATGLAPAAAALTAVLFGAAHYPNLALASVTLVGGFFWCLLFQRYPNLITLALSHGWLAVLLRASWPAAWLHNLRIGPSFWTWSP